LAAALAFCLADVAPALLWRTAAEREPPPCDIGERRMRRRMRDPFFDFDR
jgi:hypothetical protein